MLRLKPLVTEKNSQTSNRVGDRVGDRVTNTQKAILELLAENPEYSYRNLAETLSVSTKTIFVNIRKLKETGRLLRRGSSKNGKWEVLQGD